MLRQQVDAEKSTEPIPGVGYKEAQGIQRALGALLRLHATTLGPGVRRFGIPELTCAILPRSRAGATRVHASNRSGSWARSAITRLGLETAAPQGSRMNVGLAVD